MADAPHNIEPVLDEQDMLAPGTEDTGKTERIFSGIGVAPGIAIAPVYLYARAAFTVEKRELSEDEIDGEIERFEWAVSRAEKDLQKIAVLAKEKLGEESAAIFQAQLLMLHDAALYEAVLDSIRHDRCNADYAVMEVMGHHRQRMEMSDSEYMRERSQDLQDVEERLIMHLRRGRHLSSITPETIVIAENLTAADILLFSRRGILGCALDHGGPTSHVSIMARALGVPAVVSLHGITEVVNQGDYVIVDGMSGKVIANPTDATLETYRERYARYRERVEERLSLAPLPAETLDGRRIHLQANIEFIEELDVLDEYGAEGIGLMRTEFLLLMQGNFSDSEEQQFTIYRQALEKTSPHVTTFRLLDLGGDKMLPVAHREHNPFLGWRGIRVLLDKPEILIPQLRAILRASPYGPMRILLPMVTTLEEVHRFKAIVEETRQALQCEGHEVVGSIPMGIMVEVPAVALMADQFAEVADFFSLGTNDLTQYTLAVDRGNDLVAALYQEMHPAVLRMIKTTIDAADQHNIPVSLCGEIGSNSKVTPILLGLGLSELSASPSYLPEVKRVIRAIRYVDARELAHRALAAAHADEVMTLLDDWLAEHVHIDGLLT